MFVLFAFLSVTAHAQVIASGEEWSYQPLKGPEALNLGANHLENLTVTIEQLNRAYPNQAALNEERALKAAFAKSLDVKSEFILRSQLLIHKLDPRSSLRAKLSASISNLDLSPALGVTDGEKKPTLWKKIQADACNGACVVSYEIYPAGWTTVKKPSTVVDLLEIMANLNQGELAELRAAEPAVQESVIK